MAARRAVPKKGNAKREALWREGRATESTESYLAALPLAERAALTALRKTIRAAASEATEVIGYRTPTFKYCAVAFSASLNHCALHLMNPPLMRSLAAELGVHDTGATTKRFTTQRSLPEKLVKRLVKLRIAENKARVNVPGP